MLLSNKKILLGISASIAAYKSLELIRLLQKNGAVVRAIPTQKALDFVTQLSLDTLLRTSCFGGHGPIQHIEQAYAADIMLIAPATANLIAKMAFGFADELLLQTYLSFKGPVCVAPAMETHMWEHPATQANVEILKQRGVQIVSPETGELASGRSGIGRLADLETILEQVCTTLSPQDFRGQKVLLTAGPTIEELDPVRYLSNYSSGKMGVALARALARRGAEVSLIHGPACAKAPAGRPIRTYPVKSAEQMLGLALEIAPKSDVAILCAAVADYRPKDRNREKIKKNGSENYSLALIENPDILKTLGQQSNRPFLVGFAAESSDLDKNAHKKILSKNCDLICANLVGSDDSGFGSDMNQISIFNRNGFVCALEKQDKNVIADRILDVLLTEQNTCLNNSDSQRNS